MIIDRFKTSTIDGLRYRSTSHHCCEAARCNVASGNLDKIDKHDEICIFKGELTNLA